MFSKGRKNSVENLQSVEAAALRPHAKLRQRTSSPRRSSFHGSETPPQQTNVAPDNTPRHIKYATAPIINHGDTNSSHQQTKSGQKPAPPPKNKYIPEPTFQKTFIAMLNRKDNRKRRSQEIVEGAGPKQGPVLHPKTPPAVGVKPATGVFYQQLPSGDPQGQRLMQQHQLQHAAHMNHQHQFQKAESFHLQQQFFKAEPLQQAHLVQARPTHLLVRNHQ